MTLKNRGRSKKTEGQTGPKNKGGCLAVGTGSTFKKAVPPPPPRDPTPSLNPFNPVRPYLTIPWP